MTASVVRRFVSLGLVLLTACLPIPHRHTVRAGARFHVIDQGGRPVPAATVAVYEGSIIGGTLHRVATTHTDDHGSATIDRERSWHLIMIFIPDAEAPSVFAWCVEASGFTPLGRTMEDEARQTIEVPMLPTKATMQCPERLDRYKLEQGQLAGPAA